MSKFDKSANTGANWWTAVKDHARHRSSTTAWREHGMQRVMRVASLSTVDSVRYRAVAILAGMAQRATGRAVL